MSVRRVAVVLLALLPCVAVAQEIPWQAERVMLRGDGVRAGRPVAGHLVRQGKDLSADGVYTVLRADGGLLELGDNLGWVARADVVRMRDAAAYFTQRIKDEPTVAKWYGRRAFAKSSEDLHVNLSSSLRLPRVVTGRESERVEDLREAVRLDPKSVGWRGNLVLVFTALGELDRAADECEAILRLAPEEAGSYIFRSAVRLARKDTAGAVSDMEKAAELDSKSFNTQAGLAMVYQFDGQEAKSAARFRQMAEMPVTSSSEYSRRAPAKAAAGDVDGMMADMVEAVRLNPTDVQALRQLGCLLRRQGEYRSALANFRRAARLQPDDPQAFRMEAFLLATCKEDALRDGRRAVELAVKAVKLAGSEPASADLEALAATYAEVGDFPTAIATQKRAIKALEGKPNYYDELPELDWWLKQYDHDKPRRE